MPTTDVLLAWIVDRLMADATVGVETQGRVFRGHISGIPNPEYPLVTVSRFEGGYVEPTVPYHTFELLISALSGTSWDQAWLLYEAIRTSLDNEYAQSGGRAWRIRQDGTPIESVDDTGAYTYILSCLWTASQVG